MGASILDLIIVAAWSSTKYLFGVSYALFKDFNFLLALICTVSGGLAGVVVYLYCWDGLMWIKHRFFPRKPNATVKFSKFKRWLVRFIHQYGLFGIAFLTPVLLSVPVGTLLAASIEHNKWKIKRYMLISFINWSVLFFGFFQLFDINAKDTIKRLLGRDQTSHTSATSPAPVQNLQAALNQKIFHGHHRDDESRETWRAKHDAA